jgi:hypothetical protein
LVGWVAGGGLRPTPSFTVGVSPQLPPQFFDLGLGGA